MVPKKILTPEVMVKVTSGFMVQVSPGSIIPLEIVVSTSNVLETASAS